jgi:hypothetical protein
MTDPRCLSIAARLLVLLPILFTACSQQRPAASVKGTVTFDGKPLRFGSVVFVPTEQGSTAQANLKSDGSFVLTTYQEGDGAVIGRHQVMIVALASEGALPSEELDDQTRFSRTGEPLPLESVIPEIYGDYRRSGLTANVVAGENTIEFALVSKPPSAGIETTKP